ncbi:Lid2 complex component snt2 [Sphaceloma murrayae]|uniref:Lid2 complex component snt2 n=1 Tax=Sphaceloma murrayae TaxID=2082308 RepID=A0A2K1QRF5_9PEZI|nr:Lid2 complex component snt2 [Sphaceloma murrayae]
MIKFGVIGTNWITEWWIKSSQASSRWALTAVYSRTEEGAKSFASKFNVTKVHTSLEHFIADPDVEAVYIASPNSLHFEQAKQVLKGKKHVILEKPATSTVAELDELLTIAKDNGVYVLEAYRHIQEVNFKVLKQALDDKKLGPIYGASLTYASFSSRYHNVLAGEKPNIFNLDFSGGSLVDIGVYPVTFAVALFGRPRYQLYHATKAPTGVDAGGFILLHYNDFSVQINQSKAWTSAAPCEIYGEKGTITLNGTADIDTLKFWSNKTKQTEDLSKPKADKNMQEEAEELGRIIEEDDRKAAQDLQDLSLAVLEITSDLRQQNGIVFKVEEKS